MNKLVITEVENGWIIDMMSEPTKRFVAISAENLATQVRLWATKEGSIKSTREPTEVGGRPLAPPTCR